MLPSVMTTMMMSRECRENLKIRSLPIEFLCSNHACVHDAKNDDDVEPDQRTHQPQVWPFDAATPRAETQIYLDIYI